jgi:hypothetical protein
MIKIINLVRYDTDTAKWVAVHRQKDRYETVTNEETLYRGVNGSYFLFEECSQDHGDPQHSFKPVTQDEAIEWLADYALHDQLNIEFGHLIKEA